MARFLRQTQSKDLRFGTSTYATNFGFTTLAAIVYTFWPDNAFANQRDKTRLDYLLETKDQLFETLRDLNFEYRAGKYPEEDFLVQQAQLEIEASRVMTEIVDLQKH